ncbi:TetR family transcriptional regulator [Novosphingobium sp. BL-8H]|uniref:TetR family transcriptional regulator n=1 Tax=Novosphingobium sp. BL-8H TaxID=3127640 RepID=UPI003757FF57
MIATVLELWATEGHAAISARLLSRMTGLPTSSIYHHFGSMEHLFHSAQGHAHEAAQAWCADRLDDLARWPDGGGAESLGTVLSVLIDDWATDARTLAFAWAQCHLLALRDPTYVPALDAWRDLWAGFWRDVCTGAGLGGFARSTGHFFEGAAHLHLIRWHRTVDRAALEELCRGWGRWLDGALSGEGAWRGLARQAAQEAEPPRQSRNNVADAIAQASASVVEEGGVAALTHRAVATRAEVTLGVVSYNFRTSADLAAVAFETIYRNITDHVRDTVKPTLDREESILAWKDFPSQPSTLVAIEELMLAVARDPALAEFGPQLRYLRGRTSGLQLAALLGDNAPVSPLDMAIYSSFVSGQRRALIGRDIAEIHASLDETDRLLAGLRSSRTSALPLARPLA